MTQIRLAQIVRHPIKSVGYQELDRAALTRGRPLPFDRIWAIATEAAKVHADAIPWQHKTRFVRGVAEGRLQAIQAMYQETTGQITLTHPDCAPFSGVLPHDAAAMMAWVKAFWPDTRQPMARLVCRDDGGALTDVSDPFISILSTASNRAVSDLMEQTLSLHRWRGNLWLDGLTPWQEFGLIGREVQIGAARLKVEVRISRCVATAFDPDTGRKNCDTLAALERGWGHQDFGVYASVTGSGDIAINDEVTILP